MKTRIYKIIIVIMLLSLALTAFAGCNFIKGLFNKGESTSVLELEDGAVTIKIGEEYIVKAKEGSSSDFILSTDEANKEYITISGKVIKGVKKTTSQIVVTATTSDGASATLLVNVTYADLTTVRIVNISDPKVPNVQLLPNDASPTAVKFGITINDGATTSDKTIKWKLTDDKGVTTEYTGETFEYTPKKDTIYSLKVVAGAVIGETIKFGAYGAVYIETPDVVKLLDDVVFDVICADTIITGSDDVVCYLDNVPVSASDVTVAGFISDSNGRFTSTITRIPFDDFADIGKHTFKVKVNGVYSNNIEFDVTYADIKTVTINNTSTYDLIQYIQGGASTSTLTFDISVNQGATLEGKEITWSLTNKLTNVIDEKIDTIYTFKPVVECEYLLTATVDGTKSTPVLIGAFYKIYIAPQKSYKIGDDILIDVLFNSETSGSAVDFECYIDGAVVDIMPVNWTLNADNRKSAKITVPAYGSICTHDIYLKLNSDTSNTATINVAESVTPMHLKVTTTGQLSQEGSKNMVTFTANPDPVNVDKTQIEWYINGTKQSTKGATFSYAPTSSTDAEYHVQAKIGTVTSNIETIVYITSSSSDVKPYLSNTFSYGGYEQNYYITNADELKNIVLYSIEYQKYGSETNPLNVYMGYDFKKGVVVEGENTDINKFVKAVSTVREQSEESGILPSFSVQSSTGTPNEFGIVFDYTVYGDTLINAPTKDPADTVTNTTQSPLSSPHYTTGSAHDFYIDSSTKSMVVETSNMLYKAVQWGYKPSFKSDENGNKLRIMYNNAKATLTSIITAGMSDYEKVHAIYDWIIYNVRYDYDCSEATTNYTPRSGVSYTQEQYNQLASRDLNEKMKYYAYYLEGIFMDDFYNVDMHAVCDGRSKAFLLLCGIEGIEAVRVTGNAVQDGGESGHAWNKVLLEINGDYEKEWYFVDTTWGDSGNPTEYLSHAYFLLSDADTSATHKEKTNHVYPDAVTEYDYYAETTFELAGETYDYVVTGGTDSAQQLAKIIEYAINHGKKYIEFEVTFTHTEESLRSVISSAFTIYGNYHKSYTMSNLKGNTPSIILE